MLITRCHEPVNRRKLYVYLTDAGQALRDELVPLAEEVNRIAVEGVDPAHLDVVRDVLLAMIRNLAADEFGREPGPD